MNKLLNHLNWTVTEFEQAIQDIHAASSNIQNDEGQLQDRYDVQEQTSPPVSMPRILILSPLRAIHPLIPFSKGYSSLLFLSLLRSHLCYRGVTK